MREIRRFFRTYKGFVTSGSILLLVIVGFLAGILPASKKVLALRDEVTAMTEQTVQLRAKATILSTIDEATYKQFLANLITAVPADQSITSVFSTLDGLSSQTGVTLTDLGLAKPGSIASGSARTQSQQEKEVGTNLLPFTVTISGSYDQIRDFLSQAISVRRFFRVRGFDLSLLDPTNVSVRMSMDAYYSPYATTIGGVDTKIEALTAKDEQTIQTVANLPLVGDPNLGAITTGVPSSSGPPKANPFAP
jgi:Tfp pilus assembly protein PilO